MVMYSFKNGVGAFCTWRYQLDAWLAHRLIPHKFQYDGSTERQILVGIGLRPTIDLHFRSRLDIKPQLR